MAGLRCRAAQISGRRGSDRPTKYINTSTAAEEILTRKSATPINREQAALRRKANTIHPLRPGVFELIHLPK
jgi:hypothetical protein